MTEREKERKEMLKEAERRDFIQRCKKLRSCGFSNAEIAGLFGKSESTIRSLLSRN